jgi:Capsule assembly protein Wzi/PAP2 superfamily
MTMPFGMARRTAILLCGWSIVTAAIASPGFAAFPQAQEAQVRSSVRSSARGDAADTPTAKTEIDKFAPEPREGVARNFSGLVKDFVGDQKGIWTSPERLRFEDTEWLVPLAGFTTGLFVTDRQVSGHLAADIKTQQHYRSIATDGAFALAGVGGGLAVWSAFSHNEHQRETGFLSGEAAIDSLVVVEALKYGFQRQRPYQGNGAGHFLSGGGSFPSEHSAAVWSIAGIIAHEYHGRLPGLFAYGLATAVSLARIQSRDHFPSDVLVGSAIGYLVSQYVYSKHHDPELGGAEWRSVREWVRDTKGTPGNLGSPYVPLDSWVYPAMERLAGLGLIDSDFEGLRPWTRLECLRLLNEASDAWSSGDEENTEAAGLIAGLQREFRGETEESGGDGRGTLRVESLYSRTEHISGAPLADGYHFAQTQFDDFGRPYGEGFSTINGFSSYATSGRWVAYVRGELQTAPATPTLPLAARQIIQAVDYLPVLPPATPRPAVSQLSLLDAYVGLTISDWEISFGRQSLFWAPGDGGAMTLGDNVQPLNMLRINRVTPVKVPGLSRLVGPMRVELILAQLAGQYFENNGTGVFTGSFSQPLSPQPLMHGQKINFKPTRNFEFGLSRTAIIGGPTDPFTLGTFLRSLAPGINQHSQTVGQRNYTGDQQSELDWSYRLPKLRNWLTFYGDALSGDQISPIAYWDRSAIHAGLFLSHIPRVPKMDLRAEGTYTDVPAGGALSHGFYYFSTLVPNGQTSKGFLLGSWIGREGQGAQAWTNYWFNARNRVQLNFRHQKVSQQFIPGGGSLTDFGIRGDYWTRFNVGISGWVQHERWLFPVIQPNQASNVTAAVQISFEPQKWFRRTSSVDEDLPSSNGGLP